MAITINQEPTFPNVVYTNLLYAVYSPSSSNSQYQYVMDVYASGSANRLTRIKQYPNPQGSAIFDTSRVMADYLEYDTFVFDSSETSPPLISSNGKFEIKFGEEWAASISGSVTLYDGNGNVGDPAVQGQVADVFMGTVDPNNGVSYNWPDSGSVKWLTDRPDGVEKYITTSTYNANRDAFWLTAYNGSSSSVQIQLNGASTGPTIPANSIRYFAISAPYNPATSFTLGTDTIVIPSTEVSCNYDRVNFVFINNYGVWDSYGFNLPQQHTTSIRRQSITTPFVDYSSGISQYDESRRGKSYYNTSYEDSYKVTTPYLSQEEAQWLTQLLESPEVYIQNKVSDSDASGRTGLTPIVLTNSSYTHNTNRRGQKAFQYDIEYQLANKRQTR